MEIIIKLILLYITITSGAVFLSERFNKKIGQCIGVNLLLIVLLLYIGGLINLLAQSIWIVSAVELILGFITILKYIKDKNIDKLKEKLNTFSFKVFSMTFFVIGIVSIGKELTNRDQFSYWSYAAKNMYTTNKFILNPAIGIQYPPAPTILQYFFMKVIGVYLQGFEAFSMQILGISLLLSWLENEKRSKWSKISLVIMMLCVPAIFPNVIFYESSYPDALLGLLIGYFCTSFFKNEKDMFTILKMVITLSFITLTKPIGFYIAIILLIMTAMCEMLKIKIIKKEKLKAIFKDNKNIKIIFVFLITILITFMSWTLYTNINRPAEGNMQTSNAKDNPLKVAISSLLTTTLGINAETYYEGISNQTLVKKLYEVTAIITPVQISIGGVIGILLVLSVYFISKKIEEERRNKAIVILITSIIGLVLYTGILQVAYITMFNKNEMLVHAGIDRYFPTFLLALIYIFITYILEFFDRNNVRTLTYVLLAVIIISVTPIYSLMNMTITSGIYNEVESIKCDFAKRITNEIKNVTNEDDKIFIVCKSNTKMLYQYMIRYYMYPTIVGLNEYTENTDISLTEWINTLKERNFEYVYVLDSDEEFNKYASSIFKDNKIKNETLYKVELEEDNFLLIPVK